MKTEYEMPPLNNPNYGEFAIIKSQASSPKEIVDN